MAVGDPASPSACEFVVLGNTGNVYKVKLQEVPECNCPDFVRGHLCKHYLFVMLRVLKLADTDPRVWQKALLPSELSNILRQPEVAGEVLASQSVRQRFQELSGKKNTGDSIVQDEGSKGIQRPVDGDCPVCYELLSTATKKTAEPVVFCRTCGNNVHSECFQKWSKTKGQGRVTCIYCRAVWVDDHKKKGSSSKDIGAEGYVNLAAYSDTHRNAVHETLETLYPNSYEWINRRGV